MTYYTLILSALLGVLAERACAGAANAKQFDPPPLVNPFNPKLHNPFPPAPSTDEIERMHEAWFHQDVLDKLQQIEDGLTSLRRELRKLRK